MASYGGIFNIAFDVSQLSDNEVLALEDCLVVERSKYDENKIIMHWLFDIKAPKFSVEMDTLSAHPETVIYTKYLLRDLGNRFPNLYAKCTCSLSGYGAIETHEFYLEYGTLSSEPEIYDYHQEFSIFIRTQHLNENEKSRLYNVLLMLTATKHTNDGLFWLNHIDRLCKNQDCYSFGGCGNDECENARGIESFKASYQLLHSLCVAFPTLGIEGTMELYDESECDSIGCEFATVEGKFSWESDVEIDIDSIPLISIDFLNVQG